MASHDCRADSPLTVIGLQHSVGDRSPSLGLASSDASVPTPLASHDAVVGPLGRRHRRGVATPLYPTRLQDPRAVNLSLVGFKMVRHSGDARFFETCSVLGS
jgi:hypothetical protein